VYSLPDALYIKFLKIARGIFANPPFLWITAPANPAGAVLFYCI